jgi:dCMP deaminase
VRISRDEWGLRLAEVTAVRGTCLRRQVGCVLTDSRGRVLATGYNGVASGVLHCNHFTGNRVRADPLALTHFREDYPYACPGAHKASGTGLDACQAVHAEANACLQCRDVDAAETCYVTTSPCVSCVKMLMNTGCHRVVFREAYPHPSRDLWVNSFRGGLQRLWIHLPEEVIDAKRT